jgi:glutamate-1-semialdehyde 2,1-aminomutase
MNFPKSQALQAQFHALIPGGSHTYAKGDDQYPEHAAPYIVRGEGSHVWDVDGNELLEYGMGLRAVTLGHAYGPVVQAAHRQMLLGANFTRPSKIELECAEELLAIIHGAQMVKFAKNGSDVTTAAIKLARAYTGRDMVAVCADQPFFSVEDWFIGSTPMAAGIPDSVKALTVKFSYNNPASLAALFAQYPGRIACVILEPATAIEPANGFLQDLQRLCSAHGSLFVLDEMITGFRWHLGGGQEYYGVVPDLASFGKALGNGFSVSALVGKRDIMALGGLQHTRDRVFLLSTTHGAETHSLAAAIEVMRTYQREKVVEYLWHQGGRLRNGLRQVIDGLGLGDYFQVLGLPCNLVYATRDENKQPSQPFRTLFLQEMLRRGFIMPSMVVSFSHSDADIDRTVAAVGDTLVIYRRALEEGIGKYLVGRPVKPVMRRQN